MFDFSARMNRGLQLHLSNVYSALATTTLCAAAGACLDVFDVLGDFGRLIGIVSFIVEIALMILITATEPDLTNKDTMRFTYLNAFGFFFGISTGPLINEAIKIDPRLIMFAAMYTSVIFTCFSLSVHLGPERGYLYLGGPLMSLLFCVFIASILNMFIKSETIQFFQLITFVIFNAGAILYDTALITEKHRTGDRDYVKHAILLFVDIAVLFRNILRLLLVKEVRSNRRNGDD